MDYNEAVLYINSAQGIGEKVGLRNVGMLLELFGNPQARLRCFHVAGTNGKGSTCAFLERALRQAHYRVGLYTSPYLERYNERMRVNGVSIPDCRLAQVTTLVAEKVELLRARDVRPTIFEIGTAIAFTYFEQEHVDYAVIEVGLGGRLDPTNIITPLVSVITSIGLDHMKTLGDTVEKIAAEKAGIIKPGVPVVLHPQPDGVRGVIAEVCRERGCALYDLSTANMQMIFESARGCSFSLELIDWEWPHVEVNIAGAHQALNAAAALVALQAAASERGLVISRRDMLGGVSNARWPGRLEWIDGAPAFLLDGAHNGPGAKALLEYARRHLYGRNVALLCAMLGDKPVEDVVRQLAGISNKAVVTQVDNHRALSPKRLSVLLEGNSVSCEIQSDLALAIDEARRMAGPNGVVLVSGSLYLVGAVRAMLGLNDECAL